MSSAVGRPSRALPPILALGTLALVAVLGLGLRGAPGAAGASAAVLEGHVEHSVRMADGRLQARIRDGSGGESGWRDPSSVVVHVGREATLGWSTEEIRPDQVDGSLAWRLTGVDGPGDVAIFRTDPSGDVDVLFDSADGLPDSRRIPRGAQGRGGWAFTADGVYDLTFEWSASRPGGGAAADTATVAVVVGDGDPPATEPGSGDSEDARDPAGGGDGGAGAEASSPADREASPGSRDPSRDRATSSRADRRGASAAQAGSATVLDDGHADYAVRMAGGGLQTRIKDDTGSQVRWRAPSNVVVHVRPQAETTLPASGNLDFLGPPGSTVWMIPQVQQSGILWLGWNTEEIRSNQIDGPLTWRLRAVDGPGEMALFQTRSFGDVDVLFNSADGLPDSHQVPRGTHAHGNWAFTEEGVYYLTFEWSGDRPNGSRASSVATLAVAVGDVDPSTVEPGDGGDGDGPDGSDGDGPGSSEGGSDDGAGSGPAGGGNGLASTGAELAPQAAVAVVLLGSGLMLAGAGRRRRWLAGGATSLLLALVAIGCGGAGVGASDADAELRVMASTEIIADLVEEVGGDRVAAESLVPHGGDPHSHEPTPADAARVAEADVAFTNHLLLEDQALIKTIDANVSDDAASVSLAERSETYGANVIPLVEDLGLDVIWLGLRVRGEGRARGATRTSEVRLAATELDGPGELVVYLTEALGEPVVYWDSSDGLDGDDVTTLPPAAHTHLNWAFTEPGAYRLTLAAALDSGEGEREPLGEGTFTFAVGVEPRTVELEGSRVVLDDGHTDLSVDLDSGEVYAYTDIEKAGGAQLEVPADEVVIDVPNRALESVPDDPRFSFLGEPGERIFQLPQAVLGKHVHGEIDPHLWQDVGNVKAYVQLIRDTLRDVDPDGAATYEANARDYLDELEEVDGYVREQLAEVPADRRQLITTHDAFSYLAEAYEMTIAGFVVPNPAQEPSVDEVRTLTETVANLDVPAVFMEPNLVQRASVLTQVAEDHGVEVCKLYGDAFDEEATSYVAMMRHNADELRRCLA